MVPFNYIIVLSAFMFFCGVFGVLFRRNIIAILMSVELMLNSVNLLFIGASKVVGNLDGQIMVFFIITVAACEAAVGLAMVIAIFRKFGSIDTDKLRVLRG